MADLPGPFRGFTGHIPARMAPISAKRMAPEKQLQHRFRPTEHPAGKNGLCPQIRQANKIL
ncbi:MAG: hypothetical protein ACRD1Y_08670 [Terriglobales bacterium]